MSIKVTVDFINGCYNVTGLYKGKNFSIYKPIRGVDRDGYFKANYSRKMMKFRRRKMERTLAKIKKADPNFKASKNALKNVDCLMYKALEDWDKMSGDTTYAMDYLKTMAQNFDSKSKPGMPTEMFNDDCKQARAKELKRLGIDISYSVGMFRADESLSFLDRIKGIRIAKHQQKFMGAKVMKKFIMDKANYLDDEIGVYKDVPDNFEDVIYDETVKQIRNKKDEVNYVKSSQYEKSGERLTPKETYEEDYYLDEDDDMAYDDNFFLKDDYFFDDEDDFELGNPSERIILKREVEPEVVKSENEELEASKQELLRKGLLKEEGQKSVIEEIKEPAVELKKVSSIRVSDDLRKQAEMIEKISQRAKNVLKSANSELKNMSEQTKQESKIEAKKVSEIPLVKVKLQERVILPTPEPIKFEKTVVELKKEEVKSVKTEKELSKVQVESQARKDRVASSETSSEQKNVERVLTRKIETPEESIIIKQKPLRQRVRRRVVRLALTALAVGGLVVGTYKGYSYLERSFGLNNETKIETDTGIDFDDTIDSPVLMVKADTHEEHIVETKPQKETENKVQTAESDEKIETKVQEQTEKETESKVQIESKKEAEIKTQTESEKEPETEVQSQTKKEQKVKIQPQVKETQKLEEPVIPEKTDEEKLEEFREIAVKKYMDAFVIGEKPEVGDLLDDKTYSASPNGTGNTGYFSNYDNYKVEHVVVMGNKNWETVKTEGENLSDILNNYPEYTGYSIHFANKETGGGLGFVTQEQLEEMINKKVDEIVETKKSDILKNSNKVQDNER